MSKIIVRRFKLGDEKQIVELIRDARRKINIRDYDRELIEELCNEINEDLIIERASKYHTYVIELLDEIIGVGSIGQHKKNEAKFYNIYVLPKYEKNGIGKLIIKTLEEDEYYKKSERIEIHSSITAMGFYKHMGYKFKKFGNIVDDAGEYKLEKFTKEFNTDLKSNECYNMRPYINNKYHEYKDFVHKTKMDSCIEDIEKILNDNKNKIWIIQLNGADIGFYVYKEKDKNYEIVDICLIKEYQNKGIEEQIIKDIKELYNSKNIHIKYDKHLG